MTDFPEEVVEHIFSYLTSHQDRNSVSLVCKDWFAIEQNTRQHVFVRNCYAVEPTRVAARFPGLRSLSVKGMPNFADFNVAPSSWGASAVPWIKAMICGSPRLEQIRLKRMVVSDMSLALLARSFPNFKSLVLVHCEGFSAYGLAAIALHCRQLRELDLQESKVDDRWSDWLACFPKSFTSLEILNLTCLKRPLNLATLEKLVARCPNLRVLHVNRSVPIDCLSRMLMQTPQLVDLGTGQFSGSHMQSYSRLYQSFRACNRLKSLSGVWCVDQRIFLQAINPVVENLLSLNLSYATGILDSDLVKLISYCPRLQKLWMLHQIGDKGPVAAGSTCKDLRELRVLPSTVLDPPCQMTEQGLLAISVGCPKLNSLSYICDQMTNSTLINVAKNCPNLIRFRLHLLNKLNPDLVTGLPLDEGFGAVVQACKGLKRLSLSGLITDQVFLYIGMYAEQLEMLSFAYAGGTDNGMKYVLNGCQNLRKLEIRNCPFGDEALLDSVTEYETIRSLWMSFCDVTIGGCKALAAQNPMLNVEVITDMSSNPKCSCNNKKAEKVYIYRTVAGRRTDAPNFVTIM